MRAGALQMTTSGDAMGNVAERCMSLFVVLGAVMAVLPAPARLQGEEPVGGSPFFEEGPPLPPGAEPAPEAAQDQDWTEPAEAYPPSESLSEIRATTIPGSDAPIYPVLQEPCRFSRVYRSEILGRLWFRGEVLGWWTKGVKVPALVTTGPLDDGDTLILFGDSVIHDEMNPGGRLTLGWWWDPRQLGGVEASYLGLSSREVRHYSEALLGEATIARPYWDVTDGNLPKVEFVADPDADPVLGGSIDVRADIELQGAEVLLRRLAVCRPGLRVDMLGGYRYGRLIDRLTIDEFSASLAPPLPHDPPTEFTVTETDRFDLFKSTNDFHGGEAGLTARWTRGCWSVVDLNKSNRSVSVTVNSVGGS